ncbi:MAG: LLM class flavin-dependent oxidoreductase [Alphaproteobacteria bacterium]
MANELTFQVLTLPSGDWNQVRDRFKQVEDLGFEMATTGDHFVDWTEPSRPWLEAWTLLAGIARETSKLRLATYVTQIPMRNPALLARMALTVDHISEGRLDVGLGTGLTIDPTYDMMGIPNWENAERVARLREYVQIVRQLLSNEVSSFEGEYYKVTEATMRPVSVQRPHPPIVVAALGPVMLRIAAQHADKWNTMSFAKSFEAQFGELRERFQAVDAICAETGRDPATLGRSVLMFDPDSRATGGSVSYYTSENLFVEQVTRLAEVGYREFGLYYPMLDEQMPAFERIATDIIPQLKRDLG